MTESSRQELLRRLIRGELAGSDATRQLGSLAWDVDQPVTTLSADDAAYILRSYLATERGADAVEAWAEALEIREDVEVEPPLQELLFELANPDINGPLTPDAARAWLDRLQREG